MREQRKKSTARGIARMAGTVVQGRGEAEGRLNCGKENKILLLPCREYNEWKLFTEDDSVEE
jgi:hypothetical protein